MRTLLGLLLAGIVVGLFALAALFVLGPAPVGPVGPHEDDPAAPVVLVR